MPFLLSLSWGVESACCLKCLIHTRDHITSSKKTFVNSQGRPLAFAVVYIVFEGYLAVWGIVSLSIIDQMIEGNQQCEKGGMRAQDPT